MLKLYSLIKGNRKRAYRNRSFLPVIFFFFLFSLVGCNPSSSTATSSSLLSSSSSQSLVSQLSSDLLEDNDYVRWIGRVYYEETEQRMYFYYTATGFTLTFLGTQLEVQFHATNTSNSFRRPYFTVSVDEEIAPEGTSFALYEPNSTITLVKDLPYGLHQVTLLKRSEPVDSETSISCITTDGEFLSPSEASDEKILIIGASGISGHGNLGTEGSSRTTANSDSLQAFGYLTARHFGADFQYVSASGWGLKWGYNSTNRNGSVNIRGAFDQIGIGDDSELINHPYDLLAFIPDYVIMNIGGNDFNAYVTHLSGSALIEAKRLFRESVIEFVSYLHTLYPDAKILWTHTGSQNGAEAASALGDYDPRQQFTKIVEILKVGANGDPEGADDHASVITHQKIALTLISEIEGFKE